ncbi:MAG: Flp pilus assembly complex ATPase component TadA [Gemmatimonadaceae bacterium]|nr:Flp pilus assembly complex ATPase component TadA [Gemmatimonadaceae bacterium]
MIVAAKSPVVSDPWLAPILREMLPETKFAALETRVTSSYWEAAVAGADLSDDQLLAAVSRRTRLRVAHGLVVTSQAKDHVPERLARRFRVLPLSLSDSTLEIATANPFDLDCERTLAFASGRAVKMSLASPMRIAERLEEVYAPVDRVKRMLPTATPGEIQRVAESPEAPTDFRINAEVERPIIRLVDHIVAEGISAGASDIHLESNESGVSTRYRIDGVLKEVMKLPKAVEGPLISRIKIMSGMDIADRLRPQGGRARVAINGGLIDLRVSTLPASNGEKVVIRILDPKSAVKSVESLGLDPVDGPRMQQLLDVREGLVLVTGPTGSGKTTTLYAALRVLLPRGLNIITVEDPVEYRIPGIVQVQIHEKAGLTFASALRSVLRQDPDVVLIGEIRDRETAAIALQASLTGHLVFATLHTNDACSSIVRLTDLGVDCAKLAGALKGVVAQRLIRRLCPSCKAVANAGVPSRLLGTVPEASMIYVPMGCPDCGVTGYRGRLAVTEVLITTPEVERAIATVRSPDQLAKVARAAGTRSLWGCAVSHLLAGVTSAEELMRVLEPEGAREKPHQKPSNPTLERIGEEKRNRMSTESNSDDTKIVAGVVEVYLIHGSAPDWRVLCLKRAPNTIRPGSWETVFGKINRGESPPDAALREVGEETGLTVERLYNVNVQPFFLHASNTVQLSIVFAGFVTTTEVRLSNEHQEYEWLSLDAAPAKFTWPRAADALRDIAHLFKSGSGGSVEDVLRVR